MLHLSVTSQQKFSGNAVASGNCGFYSFKGLKMQPVDKDPKILTELLI